MPRRYRTHAHVDFYESTLHPFAMYRDEENIEAWPDKEERLGSFLEAFTSATANPTAVIEEEADFSKPRVLGLATKRRRKG